MTQPIGTLPAAIGACLACRQLFLVTPETPNCILCGRAPAYTLRFLDLPPDFPEPAPAEPVEPIPSAVPPEEPAPAPAPPAEPPAAEEEEDLDPAGMNHFLAIIGGIGEFLGGATEEETKLRDLFLQGGADPEAASTAVGRLSAVRELLEWLQAPREIAPVAPAPPQVTPP